MIDIKQTADGDIDIGNNDIMYSESTEQHQRDILIAAKGDFKESGAMGVDSIEFINDNEPENFLRTVRREFTKDGMKVRSVRMIKGVLVTDADYETDKS